MGAKTALAPRISEQIGRLPDGPCLDLFSGTCSIARELAHQKRTVWTNDVHKYAALIAKAFLQSASPPDRSEKMIRSIKKKFEQNKTELSKRFASAITKEHEAIAQDSHKEYKRIIQQWEHVGNSEELANEAERLQDTEECFPYRLVSITYSHGYFGIQQSIEIDSLIYAIRSLNGADKINDEQYRWYMLAVLQTASTISSSPGHFAQYLNIKENNYTRVKKARRASAWTKFKQQLETLQPFGSSAWRHSNRVFCFDANTLLQRLVRNNNSPAVVYADPPYSKAQYSRYYHVLETLVKYDYPIVTGQGRYRKDRFTTQFSHISGVIGKFTEMVNLAYRLKAFLVVSYPADGILHKAGESVSNILESSYSDIDSLSFPYEHSSMGARHGNEKKDVTEQLFIADPT